MKWLPTIAITAFVTLTFAQLTTQQVIGDWEGESKCVDLKAAPACKDEHVIFHILPVPKKPNEVLVHANKVINKREEEMGDLTFTVDSKMSTIQNVFERNGKKGVWLLAIKRNEMTGTLTLLPNNVIVRKISLKKR
jgi:hypothetical protein